MIENTDINQPPDYEEWLMYDTWRLHYAIYLLLGIDPKDRAKINQEDQYEFERIMKFALNSEGLTLKYAFPSRYEDIAPYQPELVVHGEVNPSVFVEWAIKKGFKVHEQLQNRFSVLESNKTNTKLNKEVNESKISERVKLISDLASIWFEDPLKIPSGGKASLKKTLCLILPKLFTDSTFDKAWQVAKKHKGIEVENVDQYKQAK
ncbi:MAG: hypothetical protein HON46_06070 [Gammaproteobacteria bacterium]|jgi:hypothetical protein|nr:hypothetical protein [Gammaproteobacteria bacterium]